MAILTNTYGVDDKFVEYPLNVLNGNIVAGELVKLACKRYLSFFSRTDIYFDPERAERPIRFISKLKHWEGSRFAGKPFILQDWQQFFIYAIFGWIKHSDDTRLIRQVFLEISRKCGKTSLASALSLYMLIGDGEPGSEVSVVAPSSAQSHISFRSASNYAQSINKHNILKMRGSDILFKHTNSKLRVMSSDSKFGDGFNPHLALLDEHHAFQSGDIFNLLSSAMGSRRQPIMLCITTSGFNLYSHCKAYRDMCVEILRGLKTDDTIFALIYELDSEQEVEDESCWKKCCPSLDITVSREYMREQLTKMKNMPSERVPILTKTFNFWCSSISTWITKDKIKAASEDFNLIDIFNNCGVAQIYAGIDLAAVYDLTVLSVMIRTELGEYYFKSWCFLPESTLNETINRELYRQWAESGHLIITSGNVTDYDYVLNKLVEINKNIPIQQIAYDQWNASQFIINCVEIGLPVKPYAQNLANFSRPTKEFERLIGQGKVHIHNNPIVRWCFENATLKTDHNDNVKPVKSGQHREGSNPAKIDCVIAMLECLGAYLEETSPTPYFEAV